MAQITSRSTSAPAHSTRVTSIDLLRGLLMALMALGHTRHFLSDSLGFAATNLAKTTPALFLTRWITHFCAPGFVFLAGTGVYLFSRNKQKVEVSRFLIVRGLWLVLLELTVVRCFGWNFNFDYGYALAGVLWAIGWSMCILAVFVHVGPRPVLAIGVAVILSHNLFDGVRPRTFGSLGWLWNVLHRTVQLEPFEGIRLKIGYPILPWTGVLAAGYGFAPLLDRQAPERKRILMRLGAGLTVGFIVLRALNVYGDPRPWSVQASPLYTVFSFLNCDKYPPSLLFVLMTLGPLLIALALLDRPLGRLGRPFAPLGRVPLFYYLLHIPLIHLLAVGLSTMRYGKADFLFRNPPNLHGPPFPLPPGYGYSLPIVYLAWACVVIALLAPCWVFGNYKRASKSVWLTYLL
jgi:uncharacterized membrane protein